MSITYLFLLKYFFRYIFFSLHFSNISSNIFFFYNSKQSKKQQKSLICDTSERQQQEPLVVIEPLTKNPLPLSETLPSTGLRQTDTSTTPNSPVRFVSHSLIRSLPHTPARSLLLARPSIPVHSTTFFKKSTFIHPTSPVIISSPELTSALFNLKQKYLLREEIVQLRRRISDLEAENKQAKEEIKDLVIINEGLGKESDLQSKTAESMISESKKSESEDKLSGDNDGKSSSEIQPSQLSTERFFDPKAARAEMKILLKTILRKFQLKIDEVFLSSDNKQILNKLIPELT
ncbi:hypothetical protein F8M41_003287 [Gigaspora margarita]|uniref:Uncharacterized protein n=1 Tax=Gigaspora margarita TaxID=4874 RepID=A0A8H4ESA3_GIGMA|nr:hypothetical protein F8M41_003287 [Gigaspora margarita]